jgi:hypothetical protein
MMAVPVGFALPMAGGTAPPGMDTWAVLSSKKVEESGLADLVTVGLARDPSMKLVDRDRLREAAKELAFGTMLGAEGSGQRQALGRVLKADALVVLGDETVDGQSLVRLVISDTRCGARLRTDYLLAEPGQTEALARTIVARIAETRQRFSGGIRQVFGVPAFVSRNLTHDYDRLQLGYANLLAGALMSLPGVAVIETAEARQISREIALAGGADVERVVPLFIEGEFEVAGPPAVTEPTVALRVKITDGQAAGQTLAPRTLKLAEAVAFIGAELPTEIARLAKADTVQALDPDRQFAALVANAEQHALLGHWEISTGLREAALLLKDNPAQRMTLTVEYNRFLRTPILLPDGAKSEPGEDPYESLCRVRVAAWRANLQHAEYLMRNRQVTMEQAIRAAEMSFRDLGGVVTGRSQEVPAVEQAKQRFVREVLPLALDLPGPRRSFERWLALVHAVVWNGFERWGISPGDRPAMRKVDLDFIYETMENVVPDRNHVFQVFGDAPEDFQGPEERHKYRGYTRKEYLAFLERLRQSKRTVNRLVGRYWLLHYTWLERRAAGKPMDDLPPEAEQLVADIRAAKPVSIGDFFLFGASNLHHAILLSVRPPARRTPIPTLPTRAETAGPEPPEATLAFKEIPLQIRTPSGIVVPSKGNLLQGLWGYEHLQSCGGRFEVMWGYGGVLLLRGTEAAEQVQATASTKVTDGQWDGRHFWIGTREKGLWVMDPDGTVLVRVGPEHGLPPCERGILIYPIEAGKVLAVGSFGHEWRAWCAIVEFADGRVRVNVFHKATTGITANYTATEAASNPSLRFIPAWIHQYHLGGDADHEVLLIGRSTEGCVPPHLPLRVDLKTLQVSVFDRELSLATRSESYFSRDGQLLEAWLGAISLYAPPGTTFPDGRTWKRLFEPKAPECLWERMLQYQGWLYVPGRPWRRVNPETWSCEAINSSEARRFEPSRARYGVSAHYGLVCWTREGAFYQVTITEPVKQASPAPSNP